MGVLMEHTQDVKTVAWHPTEEVSSARAQLAKTIQFSTSLPYYRRLSLSTAPRISVIRQHYKALSRRSV